MSDSKCKQPVLQAPAPASLKKDVRSTTTPHAPTPPTAITARAGRNRQFIPLRSRYVQRRRILLAVTKSWGHDVDVARRQLNSQYLAAEPDPNTLTVERHDRRRKVHGV